MKEKAVKVKFVDFWSGQKPQSLFLWGSMLRCGYTPILSDEPDYIFYSCFGHEHLKYRNCVKIYFTGENVVPDFNFCDYGIGFEWMEYGDRYLRWPLYYGYNQDMLRCEEKHLNSEEALKGKTGFCSFVYSNNNADPIRERLLRELSKYKQVDSGGRYLNNIGLPDGVPDKYEFQKKYKFSIAAENGKHEGYSTEKIVQCFGAQTIPIYWGDPTIKKVFNPKAFINVADYSSFEELVDTVRKLDEDDEAYLEMLRQPALLDESMNLEQAEKQLDAFIDHILNQEKDKAIRRNQQLHGLRLQVNEEQLWQKNDNVLFALMRKLRLKLMHYRG